MLINVNNILIYDLKFVWFSLKNVNLTESNTIVKTRGHRHHAIFANFKKMHAKQL